jgi:RimJ/RimL family protein N-acetyltransferase
MLPETPRLLLRRFRAGDWAPFHTYARDPEAVRHLDWGPCCQDECRDFVARAMECDQQPGIKVHHLVAIFRPTGALVGNGSLTLDAQDPQVARLELILHRLAWGQGLGTELAQGLVDHGFRSLAITRIQAHRRPEDSACYRVLRKAGLRLEEYLQNRRNPRGQVADVFLCGITREEWLGNRQAG